MPFWRREEPLHERLAREGELRRPAERLPHDTHPRWGVAGIHGLHRLREWDAIGTVEVPELEGSELDFIVPPDGSIVVEDEISDDALAALADAVEGTLQPPYRAHAVRREGGVWAVAARRIEVAEAPSVNGDEVELAVQDGERMLVIDGEQAFGTIPALEALARELESYVVRARRLDGDLFEVDLSPL